MSESILIKDTTREQRVEIIRASLDFCGEGCETCSGCSLGAGDQFDRFQPYVDGLKEISEINAEQAARHYELGGGIR